MIDIQKIAHKFDISLASEAITTIEITFKFITLKHFLTPFCDYGCPSLSPSNYRWLSVIID